MAAMDYATIAENYNITPRGINFTTMFGRDTSALTNLLGIMRPIEKVPGTKLTSKRARVELNNATVQEADETPLSEAFVDEIEYADLELVPYRKQVSAKAVMKYGYADAVIRTDEEMRYEIEDKIMGDFYTYLNGGELGYAASTWQMALAMAKGVVVDKWKKMHKGITEVVGFANVLDLYEYLGSADVTMQTAFGLNYIQNFMGYRTLFLLSDDQIKRGRVIATPVENIDLYYINPANADFRNSGLNYEVDGVTNLIGFASQGIYSRNVTETYALYGMVLFAEYIDGIAVADVRSTLGAVTATSEAGTSAVGDTIIKVTSYVAPGDKIYFKAASGTAPAAPTFGAQFDATGWTEISAATETAGKLVSSTTNGHKFRIVEVNGAGQAVATVDGTVVAKAS